MKIWQKRTIVCYKWFWPYGATLIIASICTDLYQFIIFPGLKQSKRFLKTQHPQKIILIMIITCISHKILTTAPLTVKDHQRHWKTIIKPIQTITTFKTGNNNPSDFLLRATQPNNWFHANFPASASSCVSILTLLWRKTTHSNTIGFQFAVVKKLSRISH